MLTYDSERKRFTFSSDDIDTVDLLEEILYYTQFVVTTTITRHENEIAFRIYTYEDFPIVLRRLLEES